MRWLSMPSETSQSRSSLPHRPPSSVAGGVTTSGPCGAASRARTAAATEEGGLWGSELRDWLVSLGIDSHRIRLQPAGSTNTPVASNQINLSVSAAPAEGNTP